LLLASHMKKTTDNKNTIQQNLRLRKEVIRELTPTELKGVNGGIMEYKSHQSSCC